MEPQLHDQQLRQIRNKVSADTQAKGHLSETEYLEAVEQRIRSGDPFDIDMVLEFLQSGFDSAAQLIAAQTGDTEDATGRCKQLKRLARAYLEWCEPRTGRIASGIGMPREQVALWSVYGSKHG